MNLTSEQIERATGGKWLSLSLSISSAILVLAVFIGIMRVSARQQKSDEQLDARVFRLAMELMEKHETAMMIRLDMFGKVAYMNDKAKQHLPLAIGDSIKGVLREDMFERHDASLVDALKSREPRLKNMDCEIRTLDGWRPVHIEAGAAREGAFAVMDFTD